MKDWDPLDWFVFFMGIAIALGVALEAWRGN